MVRYLVTSCLLPAKTGNRQLATHNAPFSPLIQNLFKFFIKLCGGTFTRNQFKTI